MFLEELWARTPIRWSHTSHSCLRICHLLAAAILLPPALAHATDDPDWIPSVSVAVDISDEETRARYSHVLGNIPSRPPQPGEPEAPVLVPTPGLGENASDEPKLRIEAELLGPALFEGLGSPRLFVRAAGQLRADGKQTILDVENVGELVGVPLGMNPVFEVRQIDGQGLRVSEEYDPFIWSAVVGIAFTAPLPLQEDAIFRIRPSFNYDYEGRAVGKARLAVATPLGDPPTPPAPQCLDVNGNPINFTCHSASARSDRQTVHRIGPGLELELVLPMQTRIRPSLFAGARLMFLLGDERYSFQDTTGLASYTIKRDPSLLRVTGGVRFSWFGITDTGELSEP